MRIALALLLLPCLCFADAAWTAVRGAASTDPAVRHDDAVSWRLDGDGSGDACARSAPVALTIGKHYELSGWVRTEALRVRDLDRSPIASGATLAMASMPFDMHSESVGGSTDWTRVYLRFVATTAHDAIELTAGAGGAFSGKAWFAGVTVVEVSSEGEWPASEAVQRFGPAYRYPVGGWIYLHIEGAPYDRGYQHGHLLSREIVEYMDRSAARLDPESKDRAWETGRTMAKALFQRGFDREFLEEMRGIADGAADAGAKWNGRRIDLTDIVAANTIEELGDINEAMTVTPGGLEGLHLKPPSYPAPDHCSAFAATGPATRDGRMVIGHILMWPLTLAEQTNVMLDVKPAAGQRVLMQSFPGGIQSGTDWYQNDAGVVLAETTIRQSPYNVNGTPVAYRARKAIQYGDNIDKVVEVLGTQNDGLYTNEWLIGDAKTNEIAMFELGTYRTKLWRSSRNEWFGGTEGFYWGDNNAKDLSVRLEYAPDPEGVPEHLPYVPEVRDLTWQRLYREYKGRIDEQFAFTAFRTPPLVTSTSVDAKVATADMASHMMAWAVFGKPNQREWAPTAGQKDEYPKNDGIYSSGYRLISAEPPALGKQDDDKPAPLKPAPISYKDRLWKGWILPASDADNWLTAGSAAYHGDLESDDLERALDVRRTAFRNAFLADPDDRQRYRMAMDRGALLLDALRRELGDDKFLDMMARFFAANTTKAVSTAQFIEAAGERERGFIESWLHARDLPGDLGGPAYMLSEYHGMAPAIGRTIIVYGTVLDAGANRYAAEQLQQRLMGWYESEPPVRKDFELSEDDLRSHNVILVGRPETNSALARVAKRLRLDYSGAVFRIAGAQYASERDSLALAANNPLNPHRAVLVLAGNSALETVRLAQTLSFPNVEYAVYDFGKETASGFLK
jgi:Phospholipase B